MENWPISKDTRKPRLRLYYHLLVFESYPVPHHPGPGEVDVGRLRMSELMALKARQWDAQAQCRRTGTCPELSFRQSEGRFDCVDGKALFSRRDCDSDSDSDVTNTFILLNSHVSNRRQSSKKNLILAFEIALCGFTTITFRV